ncbi:MAG TPA: BON domain-containing protein [Pyrinomonadaceae bacterium]|nr:BON domain-containing protein [Pyrinomonadaceae bacterium]
MAYEEQESRRSRVVVETPTARREVTQTEAVRGPEREGISGATVGVIVVLAVALMTILVLFLMGGPQQAPIIVTQPAASGGSTSSGSNDSAIQIEIDKRILDDPTFSALGLTVSVLDGKATLIGTVKSESLKSQFEKMIRNVKGVKQIDNQIIVSG